MVLFLALWLVNFAVLAVVLAGLYYTYTSLGGSLDVKEWYGEAGTALVASLAFTLVGNGAFIFGAEDPSPGLLLGLFGAGLFAVWAIYRLGHLLEMNELETVLVPVGFAALYVPGAIFFLKVVQP